MQAQLIETCRRPTPVLPPYIFWAGRSDGRVGLMERGLKDNESASVYIRGTIRIQTMVCMCGLMGWHVTHTQCAVSCYVISWNSLPMRQMTH
jgi:hypothetical protein